MPEGGEHVPFEPAAMDKPYAILPESQDKGILEGRCTGVLRWHTRATGSTFSSAGEDAVDNLKPSWELSTFNPAYPAPGPVVSGGVICCINGDADEWDCRGGVASSSSDDVGCLLTVGMRPPP